MIRRIPLQAVAAVLFPLLVSPAQAWAQWQRNPTMHPWGGMMGMSWFGMIFQILFWILLLVLLVLLIRWLLQGPGNKEQGRGNAPGGSDHRALEILKERYARGEIDKEEFEQKKKDLL